MKTFILLTFGFLGLVFFQMSGGASFDPQQARSEIVAARMAKAEPITTTELDPVQSAPAPNEAVTRVSLSLATFDDIVAPKEEPAQEPQAPILPQDELTAEPRVILPSIIFSGSTTAAASANIASSADIRSVARNSVNVRGGPSTSFAVVNQLNEGQQVEVLDDPGNGWVQLRPLDGGPVGWMADFLLTDG